MTESHETHDHDYPSDRFGSGPGSEPTPSALLVELREHVPFSVAAVAMGLLVAGAICILGFERESGILPARDAQEHARGAAQLFFHLFHPAHMLFSAAATTAMFYRYERKVVKALIVGLFGAIGVCGISDIVLPHVSLIVLGVKPPWHLCVLEHPDLVLPFAVVGVLMGIAASGGVIRSTLISHSLHVLMSTMASIFYMVGPLGAIAWIDQIGRIFLFVIVAVVGPCCASDIVFPLLMSQVGRDRYGKDPHDH